ncbi:MAG: nucleotidyltransferase domain-containing protein [Candidatus Diapherotrites archaeon]|nr:nucleotidyltransferase domain-containing protein [Candidatus Diapherotrites archaeon]
MGKKTDAKIKEFVKKVKKKYPIEKAIFFGSRARGDYLKKSDYDIILVSEKFKDLRFTERTAKMYEFWKHAQNIDAFCYTPEEFAAKSKEYGTMKSALKEGIEL